MKNSISKFVVTEMLAKRFQLSIFSARNIKLAGSESAQFSEGPHYPGNLTACFSVLSTEIDYLSPDSRVADFCLSE